MQHIDVWDISYGIPLSNVISEAESTQGNLHVLNLKTNVASYSALEKVVYEIASFHFNRLEIEKKHWVVEFWFKTTPDTNNFHLDCDERLKKIEDKMVHPILSCVTYLNDHLCPTILTSVNNENYKFKEFEEQTSLYLSFPREGKQITFLPEFYHGTANIFEEHHNTRYMLAINLWKDSEPLHSNVYESKSEVVSENMNVSILPSKEDILQVDASGNLTYDFFENLLYYKETGLLRCFQDVIKQENNNSTYHIYKVDEKEKLQQLMKTKYGDILSDIEFIMSENTPIKYNRFLQRFQHKNIYSPDVCRWIVNEAERYAQNNGGWTTRRHVKYPTTDLPIDAVNTVFPFIVESFRTITTIINESYNIHEDMRLDFVDVFIVKYEECSQSFLELHTDGSFLSFQVLLSDKNDFEGGGTYFDDGLIMKPSQGDLILHSSRMKHAGLPITKGRRYLLVGFVNIDITQITK